MTDDLANHSNELAAKPPECHGNCPLCCTQTLEEYNARQDAQLRNRSLTLASFGFCILLSAHTGFAYMGKALPIPEYFYVAVLIPFAGAAIRNIGALIEKSIELLERFKK